MSDPIDHQQVIVNAYDEASQSIKTTSAGATEYSIQMDQVTADLLYVGYAVTGTATTAPSWKIKKIETTGGVTSVLFANGVADYTNIWSMRASLTYS